MCIMFVLLTAKTSFDVCLDSLSHVEKLAMLTQKLKCLDHP